MRVIVIKAGMKKAIVKFKDEKIGDAEIKWLFKAPLEADLFSVARSFGGKNFGIWGFELTRGMLLPSNEYAFTIYGPTMDNGNKHNVVAMLDEDCNPLLVEMFFEQCLIANFDEHGNAVGLSDDDIKLIFRSSMQLSSYVPFFLNDHHEAVMPVVGSTGGMLVYRMEMSGT